MPGQRPRKRTLSGKSLVTALDGNEKSYSVYNFSGRQFFERPRHNPFHNSGNILTFDGGSPILFDDGSQVEKANG